MRGARWIGGLCCGVSLTACGAKPDQAPPPKPAAQSNGEVNTVESGERLLTLGDPVGAIELLETVPESYDTAVYAANLIDEAKGEIDGIFVLWIEDVDGRIQDGLLRSSRARLKYLRTSFPLNDAQNEAINDRLEKIEASFESVRAALDYSEEVARDYMLQSDLGSALRTLREARSTAWEIDPEKALKFERMIASAQFRMAQQSENGGKARKRRRRRPIRDKPEVVEEAPEVDPAASAAAAVDKEIQALLKRAASQRRSKAHFEAIITYRKVLNKQPTNAEAKGALKALESKRQALVRTFLNKANRFFLRQDLAGAAPYYERVLMLEPDNEKAKEGVRMHQNLQRISKERGN